MQFAKGLARFPHFLTEEDIFRHLGRVTGDAPVQSPEPAAAPEPVPAAEPGPSAVPELTDKELAAKLERENNKDSLIAMAAAADLDQSGTKADLAARLVAHYRLI